MVREKKLDGRTAYLCEVCGLGYADWETAKRCEEWCERTRSCSIEITKKAIYFPNLPKKRTA